MTQFEVARLVIEIVVISAGVSTTLGAAIWRVGKRFMKEQSTTHDKLDVTIEKVDGIITRLDVINGSVQHHFERDDERFGKNDEAFAAIGRELGRIEGRLGLPPTKDFQ